MTTHLERTDVVSTTSALSEALDATAEQTAELVWRVPPADGEVGVAVSRGGNLVGVEVLAHPETWAALRLGVIGAFADERQTGVFGAHRDPVRTLRAMLGGAPSLHRGPRDEVHVRVDAPDGSHLAALVAGGQVVHLSAFGP